MDLFAESPLDLSAADGAAGEELLCSHYIAGFADAQREADSVVKEKQLRKTATRAVVALFNAVAKHQHPDDFQDR